MKWNQFIGMSKRNILIFLKDKAAVFFSLLAPLIVLFLYLVFLKDTYVSSIMDNLNGLEGIVTESSIDSLTNGWLLAGVLGTSCITISLNSLSVMVADKEKKIDYDYTASPISSFIVVTSYFVGALINTYVICAIILTLGLIILSIISTLYLTFVKILALYGVLFLGSASSTMLMMLIVSFFKKSSALGSFSGIVSAAIGFLIGAYIPVGSLAKGVQYFASVIPGSHIAALFRNLLMKGVLNEIDVAINNVDNGAFVQSINELFAFDLKIFSININCLSMVIYVVVILALSLLLNVLFFKKSNKHN